MVTCKDCIHEKLCMHYVKLLSKSKGVDFDNAIEQYCEKVEADKCEFFQDRSKFVDVSELQQNVIRPLTNRCAEYTKCQTCLACAVEIREHCEHYKKVEKALKGSEKE